jgi:hypothetical protein
VLFVSEKAVTRTSNNAYSLNPVKIAASSLLIALESVRLQVNGRPATVLHYYDTILIKDCLLSRTSNPIEGSVTRYQWQYKQYIAYPE